MPLGLMVLAPGYGGNYNPSLDPLVPIEAPPITYDMINGRRTTDTPIQQMLRYGYPVDWSGGLGEVGNIAWGTRERGAFAGLGQTDTSTYTSDEFDTTGIPIIDTSVSDTVAPLTSDIDTLVDPSTGQTYQIGSALSAAVTPPSNLASASGPVSNTGASVTPASGAWTAADLAAVGGVGQSPTPAQLAQVVQQGTSTGLTSTQIAQLFSSAASAGLAIFKATSTPSIIPGTNLVYNPATGQIASALGTTASQVTSAITNLAPLLLLGVAGIVVLMMLSRK